MSKLMLSGSVGCVLALVLNVIAFAALFGLAVLPVIFENNSTLMNLQETLYCKGNETFVQDFHTQSDLRGTVRGGQIYCIDGSGNQRNVTGKAFLYAGAGFTVPFLIGLVLSMGGLTAVTGSGIRGVVRRAKTELPVWQFANDCARKQPRDCAGRFAPRKRGSHPAGDRLRPTGERY